jgi:hypothetical protein
MKVLPQWSKLSETSQDPAFRKGHVPGTGAYTDEWGNASLEGRNLQRLWRIGGSSKWFLSTFAIFWNSICGVMMAAMFGGAPIRVNDVAYDSFASAFAEQPFIAVFALFPLVGLVMAYWALVTWVNRTRIGFVGHELVISRGPLPCPRPYQRLPMSNFSQVYVEQYTSHSENKRPVTAYRVVAQMKVGPKVVIDSGMSDYADARILEQWLESKLGLADAPVLGEVGT